jgi:hypothetical protein
MEEVNYFKVEVENSEHVHGIARLQEHTTEHVVSNSNILQHCNHLALSLFGLTAC